MIYSYQKTTMKINNLSRAVLVAAAFSLLCVFIVPNVVYGQASDNLVKSLLELRSDVESLYSQIQDGKEDHRANMRSYAAQKADLEAQINRRKISIKQLDIDIEKTLLDIERVKSRNDSLKPVLLSAVDRLIADVRSGIPFKLKQRVEDLEKLKERILTDAVTEERALGQLWAAHEDVLRMTRENGLFKQEIDFDGEQRLVDVVKIGSVMLFYQTTDGRYGFAERLGDSYEFRLANNPIQQEQIRAVFDGMKKQIRSGLYNLPASFLFDGSEL